MMVFKDRERTWTVLTISADGSFRARLEDMSVKTCWQYVNYSGLLKFFLCDSFSKLYKAWVLSTKAEQVFKFIVIVPIASVITQTVRGRNVLIWILIIAVSELSKPTIFNPL